MSNAAPLAFGGSIPADYDEYLGPLLFHFSASDLADRIAKRTPANGQVLEIACGTGISTEYLRKTLPDDVAIIATDLNPDMLAFAQKKLAGKQGISFQEADGLSLPFEDESMDAVACQFGIMFMPDKAQALSEMKRVLKPGGTLVFNTWDSLEKNPGVAIAQKTIEAFFDTDPPQFLSIPFGFYDVELIKNLMSDAGFENVDAQVISETVKSYDAKRLATGAVKGNPTITEINARDDVDVDAVIAAVAAALTEKLGSNTPDVELQEIVFTDVKGS